MFHQNNYIPQNNQDYLFQELGISNNGGNSTFEPENQPQTMQIEDESGNRKNKRENAYAQGSDEEQEGFQMPKVSLNNMPEIEDPFDKSNQEETIPETKFQQKKKPGRTRKMVRANRRGKAQKGNKNEEKKQIEIDIGMDEVAEWTEKGTKANRDEQNSFDSDENEAPHKQTQQQQQIRRRLQQKVKKYDNPGSSSSKPSGNSLSSLKNKAQQLKKMNEGSNRQVDITQQNLIPKKLEQKIEEQEQDEDEEEVPKPRKIETNKVISNPVEKQESSEEDPWDKINQQTLQSKENKRKILTNATQNPESLIQYYKNYQFQPKQEEQEPEQPKTGFFQQLCACLNPPKKRKSDIQKLLINLSKLSITNTTQQMALLKQIWVKITNKSFSRYGEHWNQIGFQGRDPSTDIRSAGVLALVQWLGFILQYSEKQLKFHNFCVEFDFPLALTHIKITSMLITCIQKGILNGKNWEDFQEWYNSFVFFTIEYIENNGKNLEQLGDFVQSAVERTGKNTQKAKGEYLKHWKK